MQQPNKIKYTQILFGHKNNAAAAAFNLQIKRKAAFIYAQELK